MIMYFEIASGVLGVLLVIVSLNALVGPFLRRGPLKNDGPLVSVLIPARNEAHNIGKCLEGLQKQSYTNLEILVLDDESEDATAAIVQQQQHRIHLITGKPLPVGWTGKNWACHQLAQQARGKYLIFTDADNRHHPEAVARTVGWMQRFQLDGFSAFPQQYTGTLSEKLIIPIVDLMVYGMLPLWLTYYLRFSSLSAANGQWIAFTWQAYQSIGGHAADPMEIVEDVTLARLLKSRRLKMLTVAGTGMVWARMYRSAQEIWGGLSKNLFGLVGYSIPLFVFFAIVLLAVMVAPYGLLIVPSLRVQAGILVLANTLLRAILSSRYRHPFLVSVLLHPVSIVAILAISINSVRLTKSGELTWKGRIIHRKTKTGFQSENRSDLSAGFPGDR